MNTNKRGPRVLGVHIRPVEVYRGDPDAAPSRRRTKK